MRTTDTSWLCFRAGLEGWALPAREIHRVLHAPWITPVPLTPSAYMGLLHIRGGLYHMIDVPALLDGSDARGTEGKLVLLLHGGPWRIAVAADEVVGVVQAPGEGGMVPCRGKGFRALSTETLWEKMRASANGSPQV